MNVSAANLGPPPFGSCTLNTPLCPPILLTKILLRVSRTNLVVPRNLPLNVLNVVHAQELRVLINGAPLKSPMKKKTIFSFAGLPGRRTSIPHG